MNYINDWNFVDEIIYKFESAINKFFVYIKDCKELPDPEEMIQAATKQLQEENEALKEYHIPGRVVIHEGEYFCPKCKKSISNELLEKYKVKHCPECGKRLFRVNKSEESIEKYSVDENVSELL